MKTNRSKEQHRDPRNKHVHIWSINLEQRGQEYTLGKELFSINALEINRSLNFKKKDHQQAQSESHILKHPKFTTDLNLTSLHTSMDLQLRSFENHFTPKAHLQV